MPQPETLWTGRTVVLWKSPDPVFQFCKDRVHHVLLRANVRRQGWRPVQCSFPLNAQYSCWTALEYRSVLNLMTRVLGPTLSRHRAADWTDCAWSHRSFTHSQGGVQTSTENQQENCVHKKLSPPKPHGALSGAQQDSTAVYLLSQLLNLSALHFPVCCMLSVLLICGS